MSPSPHGPDRPAPLGPADRPESVRGAPGPRLRVISETDLLASVPVTLGFHPRRSVVVIGADGDSVVLRARLDLDAALVVDREQMAGLFGPALRQVGADSVIVVAYVDDVHDDGLGADALTPVLERIRDGLGGLGIDLCHAVTVDARVHRVHDELDLRPGPATPYTLDASTLMAQAVFAGIEVAPDREALERGFAAPTAEVAARMAVVVTEVVAEVEAAGTDPAALVADTLRRVDHESVGGATAAVVDERDAAVLQAYAGEPGARLAALRLLDRESAERHLALWLAVTARATPPHTAAVAVMTAAAAYATGDGARVNLALDHALRADPDDPFPHLVRACLDGGVPPEPALTMLVRAAEHVLAESG